MATVACSKCAGNPGHGCLSCGDSGYDVTYEEPVISMVHRGLREGEVRLMSPQRLLFMDCPKCGWDNEASATAFVVTAVRVDAQTAEHCAAVAEHQCRCGHHWVTTPIVRTQVYSAKERGLDG